ncbi:MAG: dephospho-CoA kinase [Gammaproteobacteria bacterium]|nr:dephospho-CoA kinase [Gammaproteobacteria bacterium]
MLIIGLTGGIGSGKSTVAELFRELGVPVYDADVEARRLVEPGQATLQHVIREFGPQILQPGGTLDRARLRALAFSNTEQRMRLESILHPPIRAALQRQVAATRAPYCILVIPLLFETHQRDLVNRVLLVDAPEEQQISRTIARSGLDHEAVERIMAAQWTRAQRQAQADDVITNTNGIDTLRSQVEKLHNFYLK